jgi:hypothetical protein
VVVSATDHLSLYWWVGFAALKWRCESLPWNVLPSRMIAVNWRERKAIDWTNRTKKSQVRERLMKESV